jgi:hypothetical protein
MNPAPLCEWCGSVLSREQNSSLSSFSPTDSYKVMFRGTVYVGCFEGTIKLGDSLKFNFNNSVINGIVKGIEIDRKLVNSYVGKGKIGILI